jgi:hypothetical protein
VKAAGSQKGKLRRFLGLEPRLPVLRKALAAIDGPSLGWLEGNFTFFSAIRTDSLVHFPWTEAASLETHYFSPRFDIAIQEGLIPKARELEE